MTKRKRFVSFLETVAHPSKTPELGSELLVLKYLKNKIVPGAFAATNANPFPNPQAM